MASKICNNQYEKAAAHGNHQRIGGMKASAAVEKQRRKRNGVMAISASAAKISAISMACWLESGERRRKRQRRYQRGGWRKANGGSNGSLACEMAATIISGMAASRIKQQA
jgi:hypothetical protein